MTTPFESLDEAFNTTSEEVSSEIVPVEEDTISINKAAASQKKEDRADDYEFARKNLKDMVDKMQATLEGAMQVASESDHPRAYEVVFQGAKHTADILDKIHQLHKREKELDREDPVAQQGQTNNGTVNNVFMTGSTADLLKMLKESQEEDK